MSRFKEGDMFGVNAPGYRGHFVILVKVEMPWLYFYDTVDKVYFMTDYTDAKRAEKLIAHSLMEDTSCHTWILQRVSLIITGFL